MSKIINPFEYDAATNLSSEKLLDYYIEDFNYSRFIESTRNVFLIGERGSGKTMTLLFNVYQLRIKNCNREKIGVYIPCKTPLFYKEEYELIQSDKFKAAIISEHFFVLTIAFHLVQSVIELNISIPNSLSLSLKEDFSYMTGTELPKAKNFLTGVIAYINKENLNSQRALNSADGNFYDGAQSFYTLILPLINYLKRIPEIEKSHFLLMIDDAHDLNIHQVHALNSWVAYRDRSDFSFKIAMAKLKRPTQITSTGGSILEGHDFLSIDMEEPFQNKFSDFGKLARRIVNRRLSNIGIESIDADTFFPINESMQKDLAKSEEIVRKKAIEKFGKETGKQITDWIYKYKRAHYFKSRANKSNFPVYSGFETIVHLSTGVVRNILYPCYWMYDKALSESGTDKVKCISPKIQNEVIKEKSEEIWSTINTKLYNIVDDCSTKDASRISSLFENLAILFRERLKSDISEPRAIAFSISSYTEEYKKLIDPLLRISQEAQILYTRIGPAKDDGKREIYYVPNRMLWPVYGLDPVGQHARVSLKASDVWNAANGKVFPFKIDSDVNIVNDLFSEHEQK